MFTLKQDKHLKVLHKQGSPCVCPYQTKIAIPVPHKIDPRQIEMQVQSFNCNSGCHFFFEGLTEDHKAEVLTSCTGTRFEIEEENSKGLFVV